MLLYAAPPEHTLLSSPVPDQDLMCETEVDTVEVEALDDWWLDLGYVDLPGLVAV